MTSHTPLTDQELDDTYRDDVREILEAEGWRETADDTVVADNGALWTETNDALDSGVDAPDKSWSVAFDSGVPASVIAAVALVAAGTDLIDEVRRLRAILDAEKTAHLFTLRQRNNRSQRLAELHDLALAGDLDGLAAAAKNVLAASVDDHRGCGERAAARPAVRSAVETGA